MKFYITEKKKWDTIKFVNTSYHITVEKEKE